MKTKGVTVLITGFEPFEGHRLNVSWEVARSLPGHAATGERWVAHQLPCAFGHCLDRIDELLAQYSPDLVLSLGQAEGRAEISIERIAINVRDARIPDNLGAQPVDQAVIADAPLAYVSTLPYRRLVSELRASGHRVGLSNTAGTFVCNEVFFGLQHRLAGTATRSGFVHLPLLPEQLLADARQHQGRPRVARDDAPINGDREPPVIALAEQTRTLVRLIRRVIDEAAG